MSMKIIFICWMIMIVEQVANCLKPAPVDLLSRGSCLKLINIDFLQLSRVVISLAIFVQRPFAPHSLIKSFVLGDFSHSSTYMPSCVLMGPQPDSTPLSVLTHKMAFLVAITSVRQELAALYCKEPFFASETRLSCGLGPLFSLSS